MLREERNKFKISDPVELFVAHTTVQCCKAVKIEDYWLKGATALGMTCAAGLYSAASVSMLVLCPNQFCGNFIFTSGTRSTIYLKCLYFACSDSGNVTRRTGYGILSASERATMSSIKVTILQKVTAR